MQFAILALNDGRIRILADGAVFQCHYILPVNAIIRNRHTQRCTRPFRSTRQCAEIIINQYVTAILHGYGIRARIIIGNIKQSDFAPCFTVVTAP